MNKVTLHPGMTQDMYVELCCAYAVYADTFSSDMF
jgi:hypothetical protein